MTAVITVNKDGYHIFLASLVLNLSHASILPRIFDSIGIDDIFPCDLQATISVDVIVNSGFSDRVSENGLTIWDPVRLIDEFWSHRVILIGHLEPAELGTILPGPLSHIVLIVHLSVGKRHSIVLIKSGTLLVGILLNNWELEAHVRAGYACENVTKFGSGTILNTESKYISNVPHEVTIVY